MIQHVLFDLDNTLYEDPGHRDEMDDRIERYFQEKLRLDPRAAHEIRVDYRETYGTALRGLMVHHAVDPEEFLTYVHQGLPGDGMKPWPGAGEVLRGAGFPLSVFSNAPEDYIRRMLRALGLEGLFGRVFGIEATGYIGKPNPEAYVRVLRELALRGPECLLVEDLASNLGPAKALGMKTAFLGKAPPIPGPGGAVDFHVRSFGELKDVFNKLRD